jgi:NAD+ synthase (glutamine-hydrolysing)
MKRNTFKRVQTPPVVAVSARAFGTDFREPIINGWDGE